MTLKLQPYEAVETDRGVGLTCPRRGCGGRFIINLPALKEQKEAEGVVTISCPYCSRVSLIP